MGRTTRGIGATVLVAALVATGCASGAGTIAPAELGGELPPLTVAPAIAPSVTETAAGPAPTTTSAGPAVAPDILALPVSGSSPEDTAPITSVDHGHVGPTFGPDLGVAVPSAPSVRTRGDTRQLLAEGLWVHLAWEPDPTDASVFTPLAEDVPILEAYSKAQLAYYRAALGLTARDAPELDHSFVDGTTRFADAFAARDAAGLRLWLGGGVVLRPYVLADQRTSTSAVILDCYLHDEQELPLGTPPSARPMRAYALVATMVLIDGRWKLDRTGTEPGVCL